jgi:hypothetical protein
MESFDFLVQGSAPEPYVVIFQKEHNKIIAHCTCPAGEMGQYCKHRFAILNGFSEGIISSNAADVKIISTWLPGSNIERALNELEKAEEEVAKAKKKVSAAKKMIAREMQGAR